MSFPKISPPTIRLYRALLARGLPVLDVYGLERVEFEMLLTKPQADIYREELRLIHAPHPPGSASPLSARQLEVLRLASQGLANKEIG